MECSRFCFVQFQNAELATRAIAIFDDTESWLFNLSKGFENLGGSRIVNQGYSILHAAAINEV